VPFAACIQTAWLLQETERPSPDSELDRDAAFSSQLVRISIRLGMDVITKYLLFSTVKSENILATPLRLSFLLYDMNESSS
jgi:hypothetical protein